MIGIEVWCRLEELVHRCCTVHLSVCAGATMQVRPVGEVIIRSMSGGSNVRWKQCQDELRACPDGPSCWARSRAKAHCEALAHAIILSSTCVFPPPDCGRF